MRYVEEPSGCWRWTGAMKANGYGQASVGGKTVRAHRAIYKELVGPIPGGLDLDHLCRNRACVNPGHLEPVTRSENIRRGDGPAALSARRRAITHCPSGHPYDETNTHLDPRGYRRCIECNRLRARVQRARGRA